MKFEDHVTPVYSSDGNLQSVTLSAKLWIRGGKALEKLILSLTQIEEEIKPEPLHEWEAFKNSWDFRYPFNAEVKCSSCGAESSDWFNDDKKPFIFKSALISGLAVFQCNNCGATVRKKHFKDHFCYEASLPKQA